MEGIESCAEDMKGVPSSKMRYDFSNAKKRGAKSPSLKGQLSYDFFPETEEVLFLSPRIDLYKVHFFEVVLKVNPFTLLLALAAVVHPSTEEYFFAVLTAKIDPLSATPS